MPPGRRRTILPDRSLRSAVEAGEGKRIAVDLPAPLVLHLDTLRGPMPRAEYVRNLIAAAKP